MKAAASLAMSVQLKRMKAVGASVQARIPLKLAGNEHYGRAIFMLWVRPPQIVLSVDGDLKLKLFQSSWKRLL
jgi:hypothetical protein